MKVFTKTSCLDQVQELRYPCHCCHPCCCCFVVVVVVGVVSCDVLDVLTKTPCLYQVPELRYGVKYLKSCANRMRFFIKMFLFWLISWPKAQLNS